MKRLNPETGKLFQNGDRREDGYIFEGYRTSQPVKKNGFFRELWYKPEVFNGKRKYSETYNRLRRQTLKGKAKIMLSSAKQRFPVKITEEWVAAKLETGVCELTGIPFDLNKSNKYSHNPNSPSLDRIDSSKKEYTEENTRVVLHSVNVALNQFGLEHFLKIATAIIGKQGN